MSSDALIVIAIVLLVLILLGREVTAWYFKTNELLKVLREISDKLEPMSQLSVMDTSDIRARQRTALPPQTTPQTKT